MHRTITTDIARVILVLWLTVLIMIITTMEGSVVRAAGQKGFLRVTVVFNNVPLVPGLVEGWGFSCLVQGLEKTLLFDTGASGRVLLNNMSRLNLDFNEIDAVFLSHIHSDHTGGLEAVLSHHPDVDVFIPESFPSLFQYAIARTGAQVIEIGAGRRLMEHIYSTGEMGDGMIEQAMIVDTAKGLVVITGCAHPGIALVAEKAIAITGKRIHLLMGGFHLAGMPRSEIQTVISRLKALGIEKVGPSHCTGESAIALFRQAWGDNFVEAGLGAVIEFPLS